MSSATTVVPFPAGHRVFVYGSLRPDINASIHQRFMGKCIPVGPAYYQGTHALLRVALQGRALHDVR